MNAVAVPNSTLQFPPTYPLAELTEFRRGLTYKKTDEVERSDNGVLRANNVDLDTGRLDLSDIRYIDPSVDVADSKRLVPESLLICTASGSKAHLGKAAYIDGSADFAFGGFMGLLVPHESVVAKYLWYFTRSTTYFDFIDGLSSGTNINNLNFRDLGQLQVPVPPLEEQKRIVAVLDQAFAALDRARTLAEANLADAQRFMESFVERQLANSAGAAVTLQELLDTGSIISHLDGNHGSEYPRKDEFVAEGVPYISANCIEGDEIDFACAKYLAPKRAAKIRKGIAHDRDVLFAHNATVGPVVLLRTDYEEVILSTSLTYYRCEPTKIVPEFLVYEMRGASFRRQYERVMDQATRSQVPITAQRKFVHTIPVVAKQVELAKECSKVETFSRQLAMRYAAQLADLATLRQSLLQKAFSGQLT